MVFNWAVYVATRIHAELGVKHKTKRIVTLLCSNYIHSAIVYEMNQSLPEKRKMIADLALAQPRSNLLALPWVPRESSQQAREPSSIQERAPIAQRDETARKISMW